MNRKVLAAIIIIALVDSFATAMQVVEVANANFFIGPAISIESPNSYTFYTNTSVPLKVWASIRSDAPEIVRFLCCVDENLNVTLTNLNKTNTVDGYEFHAESVLENLAEGNHTLKVYSQDASGKEMSASVEFTIDTRYKSPLLVLSPQNTTYTTTEVPLTFICSENMTLSPDYVLDEIGEGPISGNTTLTGLSYDDHTITVVVWTIRGVFSQTIYFSVTTERESFPTVFVATALAVIVASASLLVYFKRRNHKGEMGEPK